MNNDRREQIRSNLKLKNIYELLEIWKTNDRVAWSDAAFEVLREILKERIREVPPQDEPILEYEEYAEENEGLEEWETALLDNENQPELYDTLDVVMLRRTINKVAIASVIVYILLGLLNFPFIRMLFQGVVLLPFEIAQSMPDMLFTILSVSFRIAVTYFPLKALEQILRILLEMEFNSRNVT